MSRNKTDSPTDCAAAYVRTSAENQQYSTRNQMDTFHEYARRHRLEIVEIYSDEGKREDLL
jgi:DNA invertase Pin-like site-specific DNA recombinase